MGPSESPCPPHDQDLRDTLPAYTHVRKYLISLLKEELAANTYPKVLNRYDTAIQVAQDLTVQLAAYVRQEPTFRPLSNKVKEPMQYWQRLRKVEDAILLSVSITLIYKIHMPDSISDLWHEIVFPHSHLYGRQEDSLTLHILQFPRSCKSKAKYNSIHDAGSAGPSSQTQCTLCPVSLLHLDN